jgi:anti-sigma factor RsiW
MPDPRHDDVQALLTWYVSGTLPAADRARVEAHCAGCEACRAELEAVRRLKGAVAAAVQTRPGPAPDLFARIAARLPAPARAPARAAAPSWWAALADRAAALMTPRLAPALALGLILLQLGTIAVLAVGVWRGGTVSTTASGPDTRVPAGGVALRVAFQESASEREVRAALQGAGARIVEGPTAAGFYVVVAPSAPAAASLRRSPVIRFAEELAR